ncbi:hypothetical protein D3C73_510020 [compost metagenome]
MKLTEVRDILDRLITEGKGDYQLISDTEGLSYISIFQEGIISSHENHYNHKYETFTATEDIDDYLRHPAFEEEVREKISNKVYDAIRIF